MSFSVQRSDLVNFVIIFKIEMRNREENLISKKRSEIFVKNSHLNFSKWDFFSKFSSHFSEVRFFEKILISLRRSENSKWEFFFSLRKWDFEMRISFRNLTLLEVRLEFSKKYYFAHLCFRYCEFLVFYRLLASESLQALISIPTYHTGEHSLHAANSSCHFLVVNILQFYMAC